jgi:hypothetical protein
MYEHLVEINRIKNMDEKQILLKVRNLKYMPFMTKEQFNDVKQAVSDRLTIHGYELATACCGRYSATKIDKK